VARSYRSVVMHHRCVLNLSDGTAIEGVLWDERGDLLVMRGAVLHESGAGGPVPMDGEIIVERARLRFAQVLPS